MERVAVVIPAYQPDEQLIAFCHRIREATNQEIVVVDDGCGEAYAHIFSAVEKVPFCTVLHHEVNRGKGRGLKTAFEHLLRIREGLLGCVTADADGQHSVEDLIACSEALRNNPNSLVLGCRNFDLESVPAKSRAGNKITKFVCRHLCGINVSDTQTGLRAIPTAFMEDLLKVQGERFEFETNMLIAARGNYPFFEVPICTIYDSATDHHTHFNPVKDSFKIYAALLKSFFKYVLSSFSSCIVDIGLFTLFCFLFEGPFKTVMYVTLATVLARVISATYNYVVNYTFVFDSHKKKRVTVPKYISLAIAQMLISALLTTVGVWLIPGAFETVVKIAVDAILFVISYQIQKRWIF